MGSFSAELNDYLTEEIFGGPLELENLETGSVTDFCKEIAKYEVRAIHKIRVRVLATLHVPICDIL